jgi:hypothetical protein
MGFEDRFSNLFDGRKTRRAQASAAARGQAMPPAVGNRLANFLAFPPGTDPSVNYTSPIQRGVYRIPQPIRSVFDNNSPLPVVSAKPDRAGSRVTPAAVSRRSEARGSAAVDLSPTNRARLAWRQAATRVRGALGGR